MRHFTTRLVFLLTALLLSLPALAQQDVITTAIGGGPNDIPAVDSNLYTPVGVAADGSGNYYISATTSTAFSKWTAAETSPSWPGPGSRVSVETE